MTRNKAIIVSLFTISVVILLLVYACSETGDHFVYMEKQGLHGLNISVPRIDLKKKFNLDLDFINHSKPQEVCDFFTWIPTEWTINLRKQLPVSPENNRSCVKLYDNILSTNQVRWIIHPNQTIQNLGCTKETKPCHPLAHFDQVRGLRINTPPCCRQKILFVFEVITTGFRELKIPHVLSGGGVLGWVRNGKIIPYDEDLDLLIPGSFWKSTLMMRFLNQTCDTYGFALRWVTDDFLEVRYSSLNYNGVQLFSYFVLTDGRLRVPAETSRSTRTYDNSVINPPKGPVLFNGILTFLPNKPVPYLDQYFGEGTWKNEIECRTISANSEGRKCIDYPRTYQSQLVLCALFFSFFLFLNVCRAGQWRTSKQGKIFFLKLPK